VGKWRYKVPAPTPACLAISSKLVLAPDRVNASFATSRIRPDSVAHPYAAFAERVVNASWAYAKNLVTGDSFRLSKPITETLSVLSK